jgi:hypothetical protein
MQFNIVEKKVQMSHRQIIKMQLMTECFITQQQLSDSEMNCLTLLGVYGECELSEFCTSAVEEKIFKTSQTVRNFLTKAAKNGLVKKKGTNRKKIMLNPTLNTQTQGNILLDYKIVHVATQEQ